MRIPSVVGVRGCVAPRASLVRWPVRSPVIALMKCDFSLVADPYPTALPGWSPYI